VVIFDLAMVVSIRLNLGGLSGRDMHGSRGPRERFKQVVTDGLWRDEKVKKCSESRRFY
jgi:hypothetical protein